MPALASGASSRIWRSVNCGRAVGVTNGMNQSSAPVKWRLKTCLKTKPVRPSMGATASGGTIVADMSVCFGKRLGTRMRGEWDSGFYPIGVSGTHSE